ncbi:hypothetical protein AB0B85_08005 [Micromonospora sp. NPDC049044]|uniref:hypothetical protein n=1 Tax=unclassified Micromonospora TaxID=2617518 RepID=UPI0033E1ACDE
MRQRASSPALTLSMLLFPLGLVVLLVSEPGYRIWGVPMMLVGVGLAFAASFLIGQTDGTQGRVPPRRHMMLTVGAVFAVQFSLIGLGWIVMDKSSTRVLALLWLGAAVALGVAYWRGVVLHYPDSKD